MSDPLLSCRELSIRFGGVLALNEVDFDVVRGSITAVIGPNGAGKTTLLNVITGLYSLTSGKIYFKGDDLADQPAWKRGQAGMVRTFQNLEIFSNMSVLENVMTGRHRHLRYSSFHALFKTPRYFAEERRCLSKAMESLSFVGLQDMAYLPGAELPFGNQRLLELARAIAGEPDLLLLDEPAAGLNMKETRSLGEIIRRVRDELGITIVLVEHDMDLIMEISDDIMVLSFGSELARGVPAEVQKNPEVIAAYLGEDESEATAEIVEEAGH